MEIFDYSSNDLLYRLAAFEHHPISEMFKEFGIDITEDIVYSSFLYIGKSHDRSKREIAILHYHTSLDENTRFSDMQNLKSYEACKFEKRELLYLCMNILSDSVIDLSKKNAINNYILKKLSTINRFFLVDQLGNSHEFKWAITE